MHDALLTYLDRHLSTKLSEAEIALLRRVFKPKRLRRHQYLLEEGEVCTLAGFVVKGALKQYTVDKAGKENIIGLLIENWWVGDQESFMVGTPSPYYIDAYEDVELLTVSREDYIDHLSQQAFMNAVIKVLAEKQSFNLLRRVHAAHTFTAEERYEDLQRRYPEFLQRFPQHIIASYLGMTKETLSRIRAGSAKK